MSVVSASVPTTTAGSRSAVSERPTGRDAETFAQLVVISGNRPAPVHFASGEVRDGPERRAISEMAERKSLVHATSAKSGDAASVESAALLDISDPFPTMPAWMASAPTTMPPARSDATAASADLLLVDASGVTAVAARMPTLSSEQKPQELVERGKYPTSKESSSSSMYAAPGCRAVTSSDGTLPPTDVVVSTDDPVRTAFDDAVVTIVSLSTHHGMMPETPALQVATAIASHVVAETGDGDSTRTTVAPSAAELPAQIGRQKMRTLVIDVHPEELGSVQVRMRLVGETLQLDVVTQTAAAAVAINSDRQMLVDRLGHAGLHLSSLQVTAVAASASPGETTSGGGHHSAFDGRNERAQREGDLANRPRRADRRNDNQQGGSDSRHAHRRLDHLRL